MIDKLDRLFFELHTAQRDLKDAYIDSMFRLAMAVEYKDETTALHLKRVSTYSYLIAQKLGLPPEDIENINSLTLDFEALEYISSAGLRVLISTQKKLKEVCQC